VTHTLHRMGDIQSLEKDYVLFALADREINYPRSQEKLRRIWEIISHYENDLANFGNLDNGNSHQTNLPALMNAPNHQYAHAVFKNREALKACLKELKDRDFGLSVVVSGLYEDIRHICYDMGLRLHTVEFSLGFHGRTERLPGDTSLAITTMCGHHMVSPSLVTKLAEDIRLGRVTPAEASNELSKQCCCGVFNPLRAEKLLRKLTGMPETE